MKLVKHSHSVGETNYHIQITPKYRRAVFRDLELKKACETSFFATAEAYGFSIRAMDFGPDHVHVFAVNCKNYSAAHLVRLLKGRSSKELRQSHWGRLESRPPNIEGRGEITIRDLFVNSLRMRPDRIIIGECRGPEVLDMLQAMNTGHDGSMTTLHANTTRDVLVRMSSMILLSGIELPVRAINEMVSSAIHIIVHISRFSDGTRKITGVTEVQGLTEDFQLKLKDVFVFKQAGIDPGIAQSQGLHCP